MINELKGYLDTDWRTKEKILYFLTHFCHMNVNERELRNYFASFNERYESGETEMFIAHSNKGYYLTSDPEVIFNSLEDDHKRAIKLLKRYYKCKKALSEKSQLSLDENEQNLYEIVNKMGV